MMLTSHQIRAEIDRLEKIVQQLDQGICSETLLERVNDVGIALCDLSDKCYTSSLLIPSEGGSQVEISPPPATPSKRKKS